MLSRISNSKLKGTVFIDKALFGVLHYENGSIIHNDIVNYENLRVCEKMADRGNYKWPVCFSCHNQHKKKILSMFIFLTCLEHAPLPYLFLLTEYQFLTISKEFYTQKNRYENSMKLIDLNHFRFENCAFIAQHHGTYNVLCSSREQPLILKHRCMETECKKKVF